MTLRDRARQSGRQGRSTPATFALPPPSHAYLKNDGGLAAAPIEVVLVDIKVAVFEVGDPDLGVEQGEPLIHVQTLVSDAVVERLDEAVTPRLTGRDVTCLLYTSPSPRDRTRSRMPSSA